MHGVSPADGHFDYQVEENRNRFAPCVYKWSNLLENLDRVSELWVYLLPFTGLAAQMTKFLDSLFELLDVILFCFFIVLDWVVFLALVTRKVVWTFVSQALVETHRELVVTASKYCLEVLFLFRTLNVRHLTALINVWVIEIFGMDDTVSKLVFQTDFSENNGR